MLEGWVNRIFEVEFVKSRFHAKQFFLKIVGRQKGHIPGPHPYKFASDLTTTTKKINNKIFVFLYNLLKI